MRKRKRERRGGGRSEGALRQGRAGHTHGQQPACLRLPAPAPAALWGLRLATQKKRGGVVRRDAVTTLRLRRGRCARLSTLFLCANKKQPTNATQHGWWWWRRLSRLRQQRRSRHTLRLPSISRPPSPTFLVWSGLVLSRRKAERPHPHSSWPLLRVCRPASVDVAKAAATLWQERRMCRAVSCGAPAANFDVRRWSCVAYT